VLDEPTIDALIAFGLVCVLALVLLWDRNRFDRDRDRKK